MSASQRRRQLLAATLKNRERSAPQGGGAPTPPAAPNDIQPQDAHDLEGSIRVVREQLGTVSEDYKRTMAAIEQVRKEQSELGNRVDEMTQVLISEEDEARDARDNYVKTIERELELLRGRGAKVHGDVASLPGVNEGKEQFYLSRFVHARETGDWSNAGYEREVLEQTAKALGKSTPGFDRASGTRDLTTLTDSGAAYFLPVQVLGELIPLLRSMTVLDKLGVRRLDGLSAGSVHIPKQTSGGTAYWVAPNSAPTASQLAVGLVTASPRTLALFTRLERSLVERSVPSVENLVRLDMAQVWALEMDLRALIGTGTSNQPLGVANWPNVNTQSIGDVNAAGDFDEFVDAYGQVEDDNALMGSPAWVFKPSTWRSMGKIKDADGYYLLRRDNTAGQENNFLGYPVQKSNQLRSTLGGGGIDHEAFFGNWQDLLVCTWGSMRIEASTVASDGTNHAFTQRQLFLIAYQDVDTVVRHPESFTYMSDISFE